MIFPDKHSQPLAIALMALASIACTDADRTLLTLSPAPASPQEAVTLVQNNAIAVRQAMRGTAERMKACAGYEFSGRELLVEQAWNHAVREPYYLRLRTTDRLAQQYERNQSSISNPNFPINIPYVPEGTQWIEQDGIVIIGYHRIKTETQATEDRTEEVDPATGHRTTHVKRNERTVILENRQLSVDDAVEPGDRPIEAESFRLYMDREGRLLAPAVQFTPAK